jgi:hypothetical protein
MTLDSRSNRREIAKDISSFANERGGVVLYGIPEDQQDDEPVPVDVSRIGMPQIPGLLERIENILVEALIPHLPEFRIREILLTHVPGAAVYLAWHPESWEAPHMIHTYGEHRYYRRGNFRAIPMEEGEVERLYRRRQARRALATQFIEQTNFGETLFPNDEQLMRIVVCPAFPLANRVDFSQPAMRGWLRDHWPRDSSEWIPFAHGVRSVGGVVRDSSPADYIARTETRLFRNGAASACRNIPRSQERTIPGLEFLKQLAYFLRAIVGNFYDQIGMSGDVVIDIAFLGVSEAKFEAGVRSRLHLAGQDFQWHSDVLQFRETSSAASLLIARERWALEQRIMDRLAQCFGLWSIPNYFGPDGSPIE